MPNVETQIASRSGVSVAAIQSINGQTLPESFVFTIDTSLGDGLAQFQLPFTNTTGFGVTVNWGDGNVEEINTYNAPETLHSYASGGTYTIRILGYCTFSFGVSGDYQKVTDFGNWGSAVVMGNNSIRGCDATITTTGQPPLMNYRGFEGNAFSNPSMNPDVSSWNVEYLSDLNRNGMQGCSSFNGDCTGWKLTNATSLSNFFASCSAFNQDISNWSQYWGTGFRLYDTGVSIDSNFLQSMFSGCTSFNCGDPSGVAGTKLRKWKIPAEARSLASMFSSCDAFNQQLDTHIENPGPDQYTAWDVSQITNISSIFAGCDVFDQDLSSWDTGSVTNFFGVFNSTNFNNAGLSGPGLGIDNWDVSSGTNFGRMFFDPQATKFNSYIGSWTLRATPGVSFEFFFRNNNQFNQSMDWTNTSSITNSNSMFFGCSAFNNGGVGGLNTGMDLWDVSNITNISGMFRGTAFDQYLGSWTFSTSLTNISNLFFSTQMSKDCSEWDTTNIQNFASVFRLARANFNFGDWQMNSATNITDLANAGSAHLTDANVALSLIGWNNAAGTNTGVNAARWCAINSAPRTMSQTATETTVSTGTNTTPLTTFKLVDSAADFVSDGVSVGDIVRNTTSGNLCSVVAVDNLTTLTIGLDIFKGAGDSYTVTSGFDGAAAKAAFDNLELATGSGGKGWTMTDTITWV